VVVGRVGGESVGGEDSAALSWTEKKRTRREENRMDFIRVLKQHVHGASSSFCYQVAVPIESDLASYKPMDGFPSYTVGYRSTMDLTLLLHRPEL
jgi:hypothetical protein